jgi:hypothetical protein
VKEFNCQLTQDMITLIDREADLLNRGRSEAALQGLRKRIETLFLQFCQKYRKMFNSFLKTNVKNSLQWLRYVAWHFGRWVAGFPAIFLERFEWTYIGQSRINLVFERRKKRLIEIKEIQWRKNRTVMISTMVL